MKFLKLTTYTKDKSSTKILSNQNYIRGQVSDPPLPCCLVHDLFRQMRRHVDKHTFGRGYFKTQDSKVYMGIAGSRVAFFYG
jgi:hypothetical protein